MKKNVLYILAFVMMFTVTIKVCAFANDDLVQEIINKACVGEVIHAEKIRIGDSYEDIEGKLGKVAKFVADGPSGTYYEYDDVNFLESRMIKKMIRIGSSACELEGLSLRQFTKYLKPYFIKQQRDVQCLYFKPHPTNNEPMWVSTRLIVEIDVSSQRVKKYAVDIAPELEYSIE